MKLIGYARVSTNNQKEEGTIQLQEHALAEFCKENGHDLITVFKDEGISGDTDARPGLSKLFEFLENSMGYDGVIIYKLDRLARNLYLQEHILKNLRELGFAIISTKEDDLDSQDPMRVAFRQFSGIISELEKTTITWRLSGGRVGKARRGGYAGGRRPFGYRISADKELVVDPEEAKIASKIINLRKYKKLSYRAIASRLNSEGIASPAGGMWYPGTIKYICENELYRGSYQYSTEKADRDDLIITGRRQMKTV